MPDAKASQQDDPQGDAHNQDVRTKSPASRSFSIGGNGPNNSHQDAGDVCRVTGARRHVLQRLNLRKDHHDRHY
jgi:hypothetical protein